MRARLIAGLILVAGLALSAFDRAAAAPVREVRDGFTILSGDFHVHSYPDGLPVWEAAREARRRRLDTIAVTSHNSMLSWWLWRHAPWMPAEASTVIVLPGEEVTSVWYHMAAVGISRPLPWRQPLEASAALARAQGGVGILAHPGGMKKVLTDAGLSAIDGLEVAHPEVDWDEETKQEHVLVYRRALALHPTVAAIGSSDFHYLRPIGLGRTYLFVRDVSADGVLDAIRAGRTVACDGGGGVYGPPRLEALVSDRCRADQTSPPEGNIPLERAAATLAWIGAAALVLLGPSSN
jgi:hypothetical protein